MANTFPGLPQLDCSLQFSSVLEGTSVIPLGNRSFAFPDESSCQKLPIQPI